MVDVSFFGKDYVVNLMATFKFCSTVLCIL